MWSVWSVVNLLRFAREVVCGIAHARRLPTLTRLRRVGPSQFTQLMGGRDVWLEIEFDGHRDVVGGFVEGADVLVDGEAFELVGGLG